MVDENKVPLNFRVTQDFFDAMTEMTQELDAQSRAELTRCAWQLLYHVRELFKRGGKLLQEEDGEIRELLPRYKNRYSRWALLATGKEILAGSDEEKRFFEDMGIDPEEDV